MFLLWIIEENAPGGGFQLVYIGLGGGGFELFLPRGGNSPIKKLRGVLPGGWSGLKLIDT